MMRLLDCRYKTLSLETKHIWELYLVTDDARVDSFALYL